MKLTLHYLYEKTGPQIVLPDGTSDGYEVLWDDEFDYDVEVPQDMLEDFLSERYGDEWKDYLEEEDEWWDDFYDFAHEEYEEKAMEYYERRHAD